MGTDYSSRSILNLQNEGSGTMTALITPDIDHSHASSFCHNIIMQQMQSFFWAGVTYYVNMAF